MATYNAKTLTITNNGDNYIIDPLQGNDVAYRDITVNIDAEDWELSNDVYSYVWTNSYLTQNSQVQVYFKANVRGGLTGDLRVQKTTGQITFSTGEEPTDDISLLVRIIDANTTGILPINADMVETDAIVGETDVQGALEDLDERIRELSGGAGLEVSFSIPANGWSNSAPYEYTWRSSNLRAECTVEAEFYSGAENTDAIYFEYEKVDPETTGGNYGVKFTSPNKPASAVPVCVRMNNAKAEAITSVNAEMVATDAISGAANVQEALSGLNSKLTQQTISFTSAAQNVSILVQNNVLINKVLFISCMIDVTATYSSGDVLLTIPGTFARRFDTELSNGTKLLGSKDSGGIKINSTPSLPPETYVINGVAFLN